MMPLKYYSNYKLIAIFLVFPYVLAIYFKRGKPQKQKEEAVLIIITKEKDLIYYGFKNFDLLVHGRKVRSFSLYVTVVLF